MNDLVLKWYARKEKTHGKFDHLWKGSYIVVAYRGDNTFILQHQNGEDIGGGPVNGRFLKNYLSWVKRRLRTLVVYILLY